MAIQFHAEEIFHIAEKIEQNGEEFYRKAAEFVSNAKACATLLRLAEWEKNHRQLFAELRTRLKSKPVDLSAMDPENTSLLYLQAIADGQVFNLKSLAEEILSISDDVEEILRQALEREKDSVVFYHALKEIVPPELGRAKVEAIIREEMSHILYITTLQKEPKNE
ncbi:MAG: ferritin family protein [Planctomycetota bacterium]